MVDVLHVNTVYVPPQVAHRHEPFLRTYCLFSDNYRSSGGLGCVASCRLGCVADRLANSAYCHCAQDATPAILRNAPLHGCMFAAFEFALPKLNALTMRNQAQAQQD
jgi:hypothetical protein